MNDFTVSQRGLYTVVQLQVESLTSRGDIERIDNEVGSLVEERLVRRLIIDFRRVSYLSSQAIGWLLKLHRRLAEVGGELALCRVTPQLMQLFKITRLDAILKIRPTVGEVADV